MTELFNLLRQLKKIKADPDYTAKSRAYFVAEAEPAKFPVRLTAWQIIFNGFQTSSAIMVAGILILVALGGLSFWQTLSPVKLASLDPAGIRAEAQAIDIQIKLSDLNYMENLNPALTIETSTVFTATRKPKPSPLAESSTIISTTPASTTEVLSIDQVLDKLVE